MSRPEARDGGPDLTKRETFRAWTRVSVRYNDLDPLGHVNVFR